MSHAAQNTIYDTWTLNTILNANNKFYFPNRLAKRKEETTHNHPLQHHYSYTSANLYMELQKKYK